MPKIDENPDEIKLARQRLFLLYGMEGDWRSVAAILDEPVGSVWNFAHGNWTPKTAGKRRKYGLPPLIQTTNAAQCPECLTMFSPDHATRRYCKTCRPPRQYKRRRISARHFDALRDALDAALDLIGDAGDPADYARLDESLARIKEFE